MLIKFTLFARLDQPRRRALTNDGIKLVTDRANTIGNCSIKSSLSRLRRAVHLRSIFSINFS